MSINKYHINDETQNSTGTKERDYSNYPLPIAFIIALVVTSIGSIALVDMLSMFFINWECHTNFFTAIIAIAVCLVVACILIPLSYLICKLFLFRTRVYRGKGINRLLLTITIGCPVSYVLVVLILKNSNWGGNLYHYIILALEFAIPMLISYSIKYFRLDECRCYKCNLLNSQLYRSSSTKSLGVRPEFHTEGGYYINKTTTGTITDSMSSSPTRDKYDIEVNTSQYVPKTTVFDGMYEHKETVTDYECFYCGWSSSTYEKHKTRV